MYEKEESSRTEGSDSSMFYALMRSLCVCILQVSDNSEGEEEEYGTEGSDSSMFYSLMRLLCMYLTGV